MPSLPIYLISTYMNHLIFPLMISLTFIYGGVVNAQQKIAFGPTVGLLQTNYGETENFAIDPDSSVDPAFGVSARFFEGEWKLRSDVLYHTVSTTATDERVINAALTLLQESSLEQSGLTFFTGAEYHIKPEGVRPFIGGGVLYNVILEYVYREDLTNRFISGNTVVSSSIDDDPSGGEYGVYFSGGMLSGRLNIEFRFTAGNRNRADFSIPFTRLSLLGSYWF